MNPSILNFLEAIIGEESADILKKASEANPEIQDLLLPRAILAWLDVMSNGYSGNIPSTEYPLDFSLNKNEGYSGHVGDYSFKNASEYQLTSFISLVLGDSPKESHLKSKDLAKLGKSLDLLVNAHQEALNKAVGGIAPPGAPIQPIAPTAQSGPQMGSKIAKPKKLPVKNLKLPSLNVSKSEMATICKLCEYQHFKADKYVGCKCMKSLAKSVMSEITSSGISLSFGDGWTIDDILSLNNIIRGS